MSDLSQLRQPFLVLLDHSETGSQSWTSTRTCSSSNFYNSRSDEQIFFCSIFIWLAYGHLVSRYGQGSSTRLQLIKKRYTQLTKIMLMADSWRSFTFGAVQTRLDQIGCHWFILSGAAPLVNKDAERYTWKAIVSYSRSTGQCYPSRQHAVLIRDMEHWKLGKPGSIDPNGLVGDTLYDSERIEL